MIENITFKARIENKFITKMFIITLFWFIIEMLCFFELTLRDNNTLYLNNYIRCVKSFNLGNLTVYINRTMGFLVFEYKNPSTTKNPIVRFIKTVKLNISNSNCTMKTFQLITLFALFAASMAFAPNQAPQSKLSDVIEFIE